MIDQVVIQNERVGYRDIDVFHVGRGEEKVLVIPGYGLSPVLYIPFIEPMSEGREFIVPDFYGMGSTPYGVYEVGRLSGYLRDTHRIDIVMGHSSGGLVALQLADTVDLAIALSPSIMTKLDPLALIRKYSELATKTIEDAQENGDKIARGIVKSHGRVINNSAARFGHWMDAVFHSYSLLSTRKPVGVIMGDRDELFWQEDFIDVLERDFPMARTYVIPGADHMAPVTSPVQVSSAIEECLAELSPQSQRV